MSRPSPRFDDQLRQDRITTVLVAAILLALVGLVFWMHSITGQSYPADQFWPVIP